MPKKQDARFSSKLLTGATIRQGIIVRVWFDNIVIDIEHLSICRYSPFTRLFTALEPISEKDTIRIIRMAKTWLKTPVGSIPIK